MSLKDQALKRLRKKAKKGQRGWPVGTVAYHGPDLTRASKVTVGIVPAPGRGGIGRTELDGPVQGHPQ